jgi:hypothetical protein
MAFKIATGNIDKFLAFIFQINAIFRLLYIRDVAKITEQVVNIRVIDAFLNGKTQKMFIIFVFTMCFQPIQIFDRLFLLALQEAVYVIFDNFLQLKCQEMFLIGQISKYMLLIFHLLYFVVAKLDFSLGFD